MQTLWNWSLAVYKSADTQQSCLHLQNTWGLDVNTLLWLCWLAEHSYVPTSQQLDAAESISKYWQSTLIFNVRKARMRIDVTKLPSASTIKEQLLKLELSGEKRQQDALEKLGGQKYQTFGECKYTICQNNLDMLLASKGITALECARASDDLCRSIFSDTAFA